MPHINEFFPSKWLRSSDLKGRRVTVTIDQLTTVEVGRDEEVKPVLFFRGTDKGLILNKTNAETIAKLYGPDTDRWAGQRITLYEEKGVKAFGERHDVIRIEERKPAPPAKSDGPPVVDTEAPERKAQTLQEVQDLYGGMPNN